MTIDVILMLIFFAFMWLVAPLIIIHHKGRRWWAWLPLALVLPGLFLMITLFMHGVDKDGKNIIS
jgi:hypothetical protein